MVESRGDRRVEIAARDGDAGLRLDRLLAGGLPDLSRSRVKALIEAGRVTTGAVTISEPSYRVKPGQTFAMIVPQPVPASPVAQAIPLDILFEDTDLIVVNKPAGMAVHPGPGTPDTTLVNALIAHCGPSLSGIGGVCRPGIVHRLDKDTSGLIVAAKNDAAHRSLAAAFAAHTIDRAYLAVVWGTPAPVEGEMTGDIGRHPANRKKMAVVSHNGKPAITRYRVLRRLGPAASLIECRLRTGRTHQIRVHMAASGHPIVGDPVYGRAGQGRLAGLSARALAAVTQARRQALHAVRLGFDHPRTRQRLEFVTELPSDIRELIDCLESI